MSDENDLPETKRVEPGAIAGDRALVSDSVETAQAPLLPRERRAIPRTTLPAPLGPYMLERRLGLGGMAEVFLARRDGPAGFSKLLVVKRILPHLAEDRRFVEMFLREAQTAAELNHSNIVQVHELGEVDGQYYIAMEFVDGVTLYKLAKRAWRKGKSIPMEVILRAIADAALGLHYAHTTRLDGGRTRSLVHRDISPDNLIISREGVTKVLDFGIAKGADSRGVTKTGELKGKIPYMSPEQIQGEPLDGRSDLYSLGITLYWLLTGQRPFDGATELMTLQGVLNGEAQAPSMVNPHVPPSVDDIVLTLLEKNPDDRFATGAELHDALMALIPMRTSDSIAFIGQMIDVVEDDAPAAAPGSGGFIPSTPLTTKLSSGERQVIRRVPKGALKQKTPYLGAMVGGLAAVVIAGVALAMFALGESDDGARGLPEAEASQAVLVERLPPPVVDKAPEPPPVVEQKPAPDPEPPPVVEEAPVEVKDEGKKHRRVPPSASAKREAVAEKTRDVALKGPAGISWSLPGGKKLARGTKAAVPASIDALVAVAADTGGRSRVPIVGDVADYGRLKTGRLNLRVFPFARVSIGKQTLGTTPLSPVTLTEGSYTVRLEHEGKVVTRTIDVHAGQIAKLKVDMSTEN